MGHWERRAKARTFFRASLNAAGDQRGAAAVEFALVLPMLLFVLFGIIQFGLTLNNYLVLTDGVRAGAREFAISRSSTTPYSSSKSAVTNSAANLTATSITITMRVNGTACAPDAACVTALSTASGGAALVTATYPCNLRVLWVDFASGCTLSSQTTELIE